MYCEPPALFLLLLKRSSPSASSCGLPGRSPRSAFIYLLHRFFAAVITSSFVDLSFLPNPATCGSPSSAIFASILILAYRIAFNCFLCTLSGNGFFHQEGNPSITFIGCFEDLTRLIFTTLSWPNVIILASESLGISSFCLFIFACPYPEKWFYLKEKILFNVFTGSLSKPRCTVRSIDTPIFRMIIKHLLRINAVKQWYNSHHCR